MSIFKPFSFTAFLMLGMSSCTITDLHQSISRQATRVESKEAMLSSDEAKQGALRDEIQTLWIDLRKREMSLDELQSGLDQLQRQNELTAEATHEQSMRKRRLTQQLTLYQRDLAMLQVNSNMLAEEKRKKIKYLQGEIRKALELLVHS